MNRPNNYDATPTGNYTPIELGAHKMVIKQVNESKTSTGKDMLVVYLDCDTTDSQPAFFAEQYKNDRREEKKWPNQATQYIVCVDDSGNCSRSLKSFCTSVEESNNKFSCWNKDDSFNFAGIKGKKVGAVFGEQLDFYDGEEKKKRVLRWFCSTDKLSEQTIPEISETKAYKQWKEQPVNQIGGNGSTGTEDFMNIPDGIDEELPFN